MRKFLILIFALLCWDGLWAQNVEPDIKQGAVQNLKQNLPEKVWGVDDCMRYAVENSPNIERERIMLDNANVEHTQAALGFLPSISGSAGLGLNFGRSIDPQTNIYNNVSNLSNGYSLQANIDIFNGLSKQNGYRIARSDRFRRQHESARVNNLISIETMQAYYTAVFAHGALSLARQRLLENQKIYHKGKREYELGMTNISALAQLESGASQAEYNVIFLDGEYQKAVLGLKEKMFYPLGEPLEIDTTYDQMITVLAPVEGSGEAVIEAAMETLPQVRAWQQDVRRSELEYSSSKANLFPRIALVGGVSTSYSRELVSGSWAVTPGVGFGSQFRDRMGEYVELSISIPIFNALGYQSIRAQKRNAVLLAKSEQRQAIAELEVTVAQAVIDLKSYAKQCAQGVVNVKANDLAYRATLAKYNEGLAGVIDLQTTQTGMLNAKIDQIKSYLNYLMQSRLVNYYKGEPLIKD